MGTDDDDATDGWDTDETADFSRDDVLAGAKTAGLAAAALAAAAATIESDAATGGDITGATVDSLRSQSVTVGAVPSLNETIPTDTAGPRLPPPPSGELSLEQYALLYAQELSGAAELAAALSEAKMVAADYQAWKQHWEARMMHFPAERERCFALVAKLRG